MEGVDGVVISLPVTGGDLLHSVADLMHSHVAFLAEQDLIVYIHSTVVANGAVLILETREKGERIRVKATRNNTDATPLYSSVLLNNTHYTTLLRYAHCPHSHPHYPQGQDPSTHSHFHSHSHLHPLRTPYRHSPCHCHCHNHYHRSATELISSK
jgi:hypothetical protein